MIAKAWQFGPFAADIDPMERVARLRAMRTIVALHTGPRGQAACRALDLAERDHTAAALAVAAIERLDSLDRRRVLASYQRVSQTP